MKGTCFLKGLALFMLVFGLAQDIVAGPGHGHGYYGYTGPSSGGTGEQPYGYTGPGSGGTGEQPITIKQAKTLPDHAFVVVEGKIERAVGKELYVLNDGTDTIYVEIDHKHWYGLSVGADDVVIIYGEIDREWNHIEIEAHRVIKK
jgi:uncharacterized protein (TIGR00156 family)